MTELTWLVAGSPEEVKAALNGHAGAGAIFPGMLAKPMPNLSEANSALARPVFPSNGMPVPQDPSYGKKYRNLKIARNRE